MTFGNEENHESNPYPPPAPDAWEDLFAQYIDPPQTSNEFSPFGIIPSLDTPADANSLNPTYVQITLALREHTSSQPAEAVADFLDVYFSSKATRVTGLRTGSIPTEGLVNVNEDSQVEFLIVDWREADDTNVMAIFKSVAPNYLCNALFHYGRCPWRSREIGWQQSSYTWYVSDLKHLGDLILVAQHAVRLFPSDESHGSNLMQRFFRDDGNPTCSPEE